MNVAGAVHFPLDCHLEPARFMSALETRLEQAGVAFAWDTAVTGFRTDGSRVLAARTTTGERTADEYVLAAGIWSSVPRAPWA